LSAGPNLLYYGDNLDVLHRHMKDENGRTGAGLGDGRISASIAPGRAV